MYYQISWTSVDGAGSKDARIEGQGEAIRQAIELQVSAESDGNPWGYTHKVYRCYEQSCRRDLVYNARTQKIYN